MIRLRTLRSPFDPLREDPLELPWRGQSAAELLRDHWREQWGRNRVLVCCNGRRLTDEELLLPLEDGVDLIAGPSPEGAVLGFIFIDLLLPAVIGAGLGWLYQKIVGVPDLDSQERGDESSATYAWDQIHTEYRAGMPIPLVFGEHDVGGTVIYSSVDVAPGQGTAGTQEVLNVILALCEGRIQAIGGVTGGARGEADWLGGFTSTGTPGPSIPADVRVNGNRLDHTSDKPGARVFVRMGEDDQTPLPELAFPGTAAIEQVGLPLDGAEQVATHTIVDSDPKVALELLMSFPGGLYRNGGPGNNIRVNAGLGDSRTGVALEIEWRDPTEPPTTRPGWTRLGLVILDFPPILSAFTARVTFNLPNVVRTPMELRVTRITPDRRTDGEVSRCTWRQVTYRMQQRFSYPGVALLGLQVQAGEQTSGGRPGFVVRCKGLRVRLWDAAINGGAPSAAEYWEVPAVGDPYHGIWTYPPGKNPAWVLAAFLLHPKGLGNWVTSNNIDWPAIRNWADFCDQDVPLDGSFEAYLQCDLVIDQPEAAWRHVLRICQAGRGMPVIRGNQITVRYSYSQAHGRGTNVVPAKVRTQLVSTSNVEEFSVLYYDTNKRPTQVVLDLLDAEDDFVHVPLPVNDPASGLDDPQDVNPLRSVKQAKKLYGVTRRSQAVREGLLMHAANRAVTSEASFVIGPEALAAEIGDVVGVQHDVFRPHGEQSFAARITSDTPVGASTQLTIDRALTVVANMVVVTKDQSGDVVEAAVATAPTTLAPGDTLDLATGIEYRKGAPLAIGLQDKVVRDYEIVACSLTQQVKRRVRAIQWEPSIHDLIDVTEHLADDVGGSLLGGAFDLGQDSAAAQPTEVFVRGLPGGAGAQRISWQKPQGFAGSRVRVYARLAGGGTWFALGETLGESLDWQLAPGESYEVSVCASNRLGVFAAPEQGTIVTVTPDEFPTAIPPDVHDLEAAYVDDGRRVELSWGPIQHGELDHFELRRGPQFLGAPVIARTRDTRVRLDQIEAFDAGDTVRFHVACRMRSGLLSRVPARVDLVASDPFGATEQLRAVPDPAAGTLVALEYSSDAGVHTVTLADGKCRGTWETLEEDHGADAESVLHVYHEFDWSEQVTIGSLAGIRTGSGEAQWRRIGGRESSLGRPGMQSSLRIGDLAGRRIGDGPGFRRAGVVGSRAEAIVEFRTARDGHTLSAQPWRRYRGPITETFRRVQVRVEILRHDLAATPRLARLAIRRFTP